MSYDLLLLKDQRLCGVEEKFCYGGILGRGARNISFLSDAKNLKKE